MPDVRKRSDTLQHLGLVTDHDLAYLFDRALCLAFPSFTEGFGLPVLEAMALGCPVISTDRASLPEICGKATLLAPPDQPQQWTAHVKALTTCSNLRHDLVEQERRQAALFSSAGPARSYMDLLNSSWRRSMICTSKSTKLPSVTVVIATLDRPEIVEQTIKRILSRQTLKPDSVIVSCIKPEDAGGAKDWSCVTVVTGPAGLAAQRNTALNSLPESNDLVVFFDDDFVPDANWLDVAARLFQEQSDIVSLTGDLIADGIKGPGLSFDDVDHLIGKAGPLTTSPLIEPFSPYGCNMAFRQEAIQTLRFDERLVLYGWLEDRDFGATLRARGGRIVKCMAARGVHMGVKGGRITGDRLGYSQIVNPIYMLRKGTMTYPQALDHLFRNFASNLTRSIAPEPFIDRRGRLRGNLHGMRDVLLGRIQPERALEIRSKAIK